ncbi:MAG TPA: type V CRISPR-associated protein Cas12b [Silvibacterium sp.]|nr:type V CRISPR-associated protein Cas12b [Silvibacterium sp.]
MAMDEQYLPPTTQRAYTLRLQPAVSANDSPEKRQRKTAEMQSALWATHDAVNRGAKTFGDWLLTLRGGLDHNLANAPVKDKKGPRAPNDQEKKNRRILLALSWLSVEDEHGAKDHAEYIVAKGDKCSAQPDNQDSRNTKVLAALRGILSARRVANDEIDAWVSDCRQSLSAAIRPDAVWVNRSLAFDAAQKRIGPSLTRDKVWDFLGPFFGDAASYLKYSDEAGPDTEDKEAKKEEGKEKDLSQFAGQWLSSRFGTGPGANFSQFAEVYQLLANQCSNLAANQSGASVCELLADAVVKFPLVSKDVQGVLALVSGPGYKSATRNHLNRISVLPNLSESDIKKLKEACEKDAAESQRKIGGKGRQAYSDAILSDVETACGFTYAGKPSRHWQYAVILDHAARHVSLVHSWIKRAEAERRNFESDAQKIQNVLGATRVWLDEFSERRSGTTGAAGEYRIRPRAIAGWDEIVKKWSHKDCATEQDRIDTARAVQADWDEGKKFGDIRIFEALASDDAKIVWEIDGKSDPSVLIDYVAARDAEARQVRFKVPAYRHPDPLLHPVFCDFGNSRWDVSFAVHKQQSRPLKRKSENAAQNDLRTLEMGLWTGNVIQQTPLRWASKLLLKDFALESSSSEGTTPVSRASRLGRAASGAGKDITILNVFEEKEWNGRLQAPREQLDRIAALRARNKHEAAAKLQNNLHWLVTFAARLRPQGPFHEFAKKNGIKPNRKGEYFPNSDFNKTRPGKKAKLSLSRFPGLRLLSVDLGHRFAAAGAVWQALSSEEFSAEINSVKSEGARIKGRGQGLYIHVIRKREKPYKNTKKIIEESTIYRRIGPDEILDAATGELTPHPAPWARLDRQFLIKLQGEEHHARRANHGEEALVKRIEQTLGRVRNPSDRTDALSKQVDDLQWDAVRTARLALRRHGDRARIAFAMTAAYKPMPGDRKYYFSPRLGGGGFNDTTDQLHQKHVEFLLDALNYWYQIFTTAKWQDDAAKALWETHIATLPNYQMPEAIAEDLSGPERKKKRGENLDHLRPSAEALLNDNALRSKLHDLWRERWELDDATWRGKEGHLRKLQDWIRPSKNAARESIRNVGGLSLQRLATLTELRRKVQAAYFSRLHPDGSKEPLKEQFGQRSLDALERMREQRVKQLASRIVEAALGVGRKQEDEKRRPHIPRDPSCHAIVIESLRHYRPDDLRTRRENRALMDWSSGKVRKYLEESCQLHGLHLREVPPNYTSRQCSRTALPGIRCEECTVEQFKASPRWKKAAENAKERLKKGGSDDDRLLADLWAKYADATTSDSRKKPIRLPRAGGDLFFAAPSYEIRGKLERHAPCMAEDCEICNSIRGAIQADLNAAANIGLRALLDPDFPGKWWFVPCNVKDGKPAQDQVKGSACFNNPEISLLEIGEKSNEQKKSKDGKDVVYAWRDPSVCGLQSAHSWPGTTKYWNMVKSRAIHALRLYNGLDPKTNSGQIA